MSPSVEELLRELAPQVLAAVVRRYQAFDVGEDAVQEALLAAALQWPTEGVPDNPRGWLVTVASRRLADLWRSDEARIAYLAAARATTSAPERGYLEGRAARITDRGTVPGAGPSGSPGTIPQGASRARSQPDPR